MNPVVTRLVPEARGISYCVADRNLRLIEIGDAAGLFPRGQIAGSVFEIVPGLKYYASTLNGVLAGKQASFEQTGIPHTTRDGRTVGLTLTVLPRTGQNCEIVGLLLLMQIAPDNKPDGQPVAQAADESCRLQDELGYYERQLRAARTELHSLDEMKSKFISLAAHELRSPLTAISGYLELLLDGDSERFTELQRDYLKIIQSSTRQLLATTNDLLDLTRLEAGRVELVLQPTDLAALLRSVIADRMAEIEARTQQLTVEIEEALPRALCDRLRTLQILNHLIAYAMRATPAGGKITVTLKRASQKGLLTVSVHSGNTWIATTARSTPSEQSGQPNGKTFAVGRGNELGLQIARALVELHGGRMWIENEAGQRIVCYVALPVADEV